MVWSFFFFFLKHSKQQPLYWELQLKTVRAALIHQWPGPSPGLLDKSHSSDSRQWLSWNKGSFSPTSQWQPWLTRSESVGKREGRASVQKTKISKSKEVKLGLRSVSLPAFWTALAIPRAMSSGTFCDAGNILPLHCPIRWTLATCSSEHLKCGSGD